MTFDLSGIPDELQEYIVSSVEMRKAALLGVEKEIKAALQESINRIKERIGRRGVFKGVSKDLADFIEEQKIYFAAELERIIEEGLKRASYAGLGIGASIAKKANILKGSLVDNDTATQAAAIAQSTLHKKRMFKDKEFVLSDRIWDLSGNNYDKIKEIISSGINTDCVKVAKALEQYVKKGAETFAKDYPNMMKRMGGRIPKNLNYEALRLARNELSEVYFQSTIEGYKDNPAIKAVKWCLSNNRIKGYHCQCETLAYSDSHGLGVGVYPVDDVPARPHIHCLCHLLPLIDRVVKEGTKANKPPENWKEIRERLSKTGAFINTDELADAEKEALKEQRQAAYRKRAIAKREKNAELEQKLETLHDKPTEYSTVYRQRYGEKLNAGKQNRHIYGHKSVKENASYFKNDLKTLQKVVNEKAGTGEIALTKKRLIEIIQDDRLDGFAKSIIDGSIHETNKAKIHYSKTGVHLVPFYEWNEQE